MLPGLDEDESEAEEKPLYYKGEFFGLALSDV